MNQAIDLEVRGRRASGESLCQLIVDRAQSEAVRQDAARCLPLLWEPVTADAQPRYGVERFNGTVRRREEGMGHREWSR